MITNNKTEYSRNVSSNLYLSHAPCARISVHLYPFTSNLLLSVDKLVGLLAYNWLKKPRMGSSTPALSICSPYPMATCPKLFLSHSWCGYSTLPRTYITLKLRTFTSCQGTCTHPQIIIFFHVFFKNKFSFFSFKLHGLFQLNWKQSPKFLFQNCNWRLVKGGGKYSFERNVLLTNSDIILWAMGNHHFVVLTWSEMIRAMV